jgi:DNA-binding MarR family transcriptional regulator
MILAKEEIPMALRAAYLTMHRLSNARFAEHGVTADQFVLLATLARGQALTQRELASRMPSDPSTVRAMLALLEQRGLVHRDAHPTDRRARTATLTTTGRRMFQELWIAGEMIRTQMVDSMSAEEADILVRLLRQVAESLSPEDAVAGAVSSS